MESEDSERLLSDLLAVAENELKADEQQKNPRKLTEANIFENETDDTPTTSKPNNFSLIHSGDTDSSDDEANKNYENRKYNAYGRDIKYLLDTSTALQSSGVRNSSPWKTTTKEASTSRQLVAPQKPDTFPNPDVYTDPFFGIRIVNPLISSAIMRERMVGREAVYMSRIKYFLTQKPEGKDWVIAGVIVSKFSKTSQKGNQFCVWTLSDLHTDLKTVSLFLFGSAYKQFWKLTAGTVIGVLNPSVLENKAGSKNEASLSVDNSQKIMIFGQSKDLGTCRSTRKDGEKCTSFVNVNHCEFCLYHIKQEYQNCSKRSEFQSNFAGRGLTALQNKLLGKQELAYGGKVYTSIPAVKSKKMSAKDENRLKLLLGLNPAVVSKGPKTAKQKKAAAQVEMAVNQKRRDLELLKKLGGLKESTGIETKSKFVSQTVSSTVTLEESKKTALNVISKLKERSVVKEQLLEENGCVDSSVNSSLCKNNEEVSIPKACDLNLSNSSVESDTALEKSNVCNKRVVKILQNVQIPKLNHSQEIDLSIDYKEIKKTSAKLPSSPNVENNCIIDKATDKLLTFAKSKGLKSPEETKSSKEKLKNAIQETEAQLKDKILQTFSKDKSAVASSSQYLKEGKNKNHLGEADLNVDHINVKNSCTSTQNLINSYTKVENKPNKATSMDTAIILHFKTDRVDLNAPISRKQITRAKLNAVKYVQQNGPIPKSDPNSIRTSAKKRPLFSSESSEINAKKQKIEQNEFYSERFKKIMAMTSAHADLIEQHDNEEQEKYFTKQEMKERLEEKMMTTFKVPCKAVHCTKCKYTSFSAAERCKMERHPLRVFDAMKRFFKCGDCGNRTVCLEVVPTTQCKNCGSGRWERASMIKERIVGSTHSLSIRGGEQKFVNSVVTDTNINLLVGDD